MVTAGHRQQLRCRSSTSPPQVCVPLSLSPTTRATRIPPCPPFMIGAVAKWGCFRHDEGVSGSTIFRVSIPKQAPFFPKIDNFILGGEIEGREIGLDEVLVSPGKILAFSFGEHHRNMGL
ncbi:unnamed protein product, partial [Cuscuta europaea]